MDATPEQLLNEFGINTFGPLFMAQAVVKLGKMPQGGRIINIGTIGSKLGPSILGIYSASKAAEDSLTASLAGELGRTHGITVNTVAPGPVETDIVINGRKVWGSDPTASLRALARGSDRMGFPEDIAVVVAWLASEKSRWVTAQYISASAGIIGTA
jgi:NAD(P)-dependent dehydrogenase (short-subunit alcohol dehydrogenase family)